MQIPATKKGKAVGRPRSFDRDKVLARAMRTFWKHGYEGASVPTLTDAMGITAQSLYAAFGSKAALYQEALEHYAQGAGAYAARALAEEADIFAAVARVLRESAERFTAKHSPRGCMISLEMLSCSPEGEIVAKQAKALRRTGLMRLQARLEQAVGEKQLTADTDVAAWARFFYANVQGMACQARDGAGRQDLLALGEVAMHSLRGLAEPSKSSSKTM